MRKYDIRFCDCGRIHAIPQEVIDKAITNDQEVMLVCTNCGAQVVIGADTFTDPDITDGPCYSMYTERVRRDSFSISANDFKAPGRGKTTLSTIMFDMGIKVPMETGEYANRHYHGGFVDDQQIGCITEQMTTVDVDRFIRENDEDIVEAVSGFHIPHMDWTGTKFKKY